MALPAYHNIVQQRPVGFLDSGVGGLSVLREVKKLLPHERMVYLADSGFAPYGDRSAEEIRERVFQLTEHLISRDIKTLVIACNTATAVAIDELRATFAIPIIGVEPALKPAVAMTKAGVVGIMATRGTLASKRIEVLINRYGNHVQIIPQVCTDLVSQIERNPFNCGETEVMIRKHVLPMAEAGADIIVLGCTHFPIVKSLISDVVGPKVKVLDTGMPVARLLKKRLQEDDLLATTQLDTDELLTSGDQILLQQFIPYTGLRKYRILPIP